MPPIVHVMRHGQGFHSAEVSGEDGVNVRDAELTDKGKEQCRQRCKAFDRHEHVELLLASPLRRALQTCLLSFRPCVERGLKIHAVPYAEEVSTAPSDTGSEASVLREEFGSEVDFSFLKHEWWKHEGVYATDPKAVNERARKLRHWIREREEKEVVLVAHGFFNHFLTGEVDDKGEQTTPWWKETELRTYTFGEQDEHSAMLYETKESLIARGEGEDDDRDRVPVVNDPRKRQQMPQ